MKKGSQDNCLNCCWFNFNTRKQM